MTTAMWIVRDARVGVECVFRTVRRVMRHAYSIITPYTLPLSKGMCPIVQRCYISRVVLWAFSLTCF